ncbi:MAG: hypothetical protein MI717_12675 [Spirochaetales bacterium]|nr:hypothetical protein [Spirochaetales bacterium]
MVVRRILLLFAVILLPLIEMNADEHQPGDRGVGRVKIGVSAGKSPNLTAGFPIGTSSEVSTTIGTNWKLSSILFAVNPQFKVVNIRFGKEVFPLSLGPHLGLKFIDGGYLSVEAMGILRWQYTFSFPINVYIEGGGGASYKAGKGKSDISLIWTANIGLRYVL